MLSATSWDILFAAPDGNLEDTYMFKILYSEFKNHKKPVMVYITLCIILSFVVGSSMPLLDPHGITASASVTNCVNAAEVSAEDTLINLNGQILGGRLNALAGDYSGTVAVSAEPFTALLFLSAVSNINKLANNPLNMPPIPLDSPWILIVIAVFFAASKFMKANSATKVFGICTLGYLERFLGTLCILVIGILSVVGISTNGAVSAVNAATEAVSEIGKAGAAAPGSQNVIVGALASLFSAFMAVMSLIVNFIIRTVSKGLDAMQAIFSTVPFVSVVCEAGKAFLVLLVSALNVFFPIAGYVVNIIVFIICCVLFRVCYYASRYFENIYFKPFFRKIFGLRDRVTLIPKRYPKKLRLAIEAKEMKPDFIIPVYIKRRHRNSTLRIRPLRRLWLIHDEGGTKLYSRRYMKQKDYFRDFDKDEGGEIFLKKGIMQYEIYSYIQTDRNLEKKWPVRDFTLVFAKDYKAYIDDIVRLTGYTDIVEEKAREKAEKKELRKAGKKLKLWVSSEED